jgi:hypothetical protein
VTQLLAAGPLLTDGIIGAYNPAARALNLRNNFLPLVDEILALPGIDLCGLAGIGCTEVAGQGTGAATPAVIDGPTSPIASLLELLDPRTGASGGER